MFAPFSGMCFQECEYIAKQTRIHLDAPFSADTSFAYSAGTRYADHFFGELR